MKERMPAYGGQAVIEGVMMRGKNAVAMAARAPDGEIIVHKELLTGIYKTNILKIPFIRGLISLWDALGLGMRYLTLSANIQTGEDEKLEGPAFFFTFGLSLLFGVVIFFLIPAALAGLLENWSNMSAWWSNLIEGAIRLLILILYLWIIGKLSDIKRVFAYHGAEHKTINAFEAKAKLTPEIVSQYSTEHPRCGTSFILTLVLMSILIFSFFGPLPLLWRLITRILMIPVIAGLAYEYFRWTAAHMENPIIRLLIKPNLALQKLSTREPGLDMLEVSIKAFNTMYAMENQEKQEQK